MPGPLQDELRTAIRAGLCFTTTAASATAALGQRFYDSVGARGIGQLSGQAAQLWDNAAGLACNRAPRDISPALGVPFQGGQCPALYRMTAQPAKNGVLFASPSTKTGVGPISYEAGPNDPTGSFARISIPANNNWFIAGTSEAGAVISYVVQSLEKLDGQPDDCGSLPPVAPPYNPDDFTTTPTVTYTDDEGVDRTISPTLVFAPITTNLNNQFTVPVEITLGPGSQLFGDFNLTTGDVNIGPGNSGGGGSGGPEREKDPGEELEEGEEIIGVRVISTVDSLGKAQLTEIATVGDAPNLYVPRVASVLFRYETAVGTGWSQPFDVQTLDAVIYSGEPAIDAGVTFRTSVTGSYKLVLRKTVGQ